MQRQHQRPLLRHKKLSQQLVNGSTKVEQKVLDQTSAYTGYYLNALTGQYQHLSITCDDADLLPLILHGGRPPIDEISVQRIV